MSTINLKKACEPEIKANNNKNLWEFKAMFKKKKKEHGNCYSQKVKRNYFTHEVRIRGYKKGVVIKQGQ